MTRGYTLLEILVAVTLMMLIMLGLTQLFSSVGTQINNTQATLQLAGELRSAKTRLESDLKLVTADLTKAPPMKTGVNQGYFCIIEGMGAAHTNDWLRNQGFVAGKDIAFTSDSNESYDNTVGDMDDILMFTAHAPEGQPFRGLVGGQVRESNMAEIIWFCRGNTLYRRTLLIVPGSESLDTDPNGFYQRNDVSVRFENGRVIANSLEDLALRQNRFGHAVSAGATLQKFREAFPFNIHKNSAVYYLRMPTIQETSLSTWDVSESFDENLRTCLGLGPSLGYTGGITTGNSETLPDGTGPFIDFWEDPLPWAGFPVTGERYAEDAILNNVISFDIQVWDDDAKRYVNLGEARDGFYDDGMSAGPFGGQGNYPLRKQNAYTDELSWIALPCVYDTWSEEYEREGYMWPDQDGVLTETQGRNQRDDNRNGVIDDIDEWTTPPPYSVPLRGVKISIRAFDPLSKNIREMTIIHNFVGK